MVLLMGVLTSKDCLLLSISIALPPFSWCFLRQFFKLLIEVAFIQANFIGNPLYRQVRIFQQLLCMAHSNLGQVFMHGAMSDRPESKF